MKDKIYYHYCGARSLLSIIESQSIWLSASTTMNDRSECLWASHVLGEMVKDDLRHEDPEENEKRKKELLIKLYSYHSQIGELNTNYIFSMSEKEDSLSQWRSYANDGKGVAIGFNCSNFIVDKKAEGDERANPYLQKVKYVSANEMASEIEGFFDSVTKGKTEHEIYTIFSNQITELNEKYKNKAFEEESEVRLIKKFANTNLFEPIGMQIKEHVKIRESNDNLVSFYEYKLPELFKVKNPISKIVLGPKSQINKTDLKLLLYKYSVTADIEKSAATYR